MSREADVVTARRGPAPAGHARRAPGAKPGPGVAGTPQGPGAATWRSPDRRPAPGRGAPRPHCRTRRKRSAARLPAGPRCRPRRHGSPLGTRTGPDEGGSTPAAVRAAQLPPPPPDRPLAGRSSGPARRAARGHRGRATAEADGAGLTGRCSPTGRPAAEASPQGPPRAPAPGGAAGVPRASTTPARGPVADFRQRSAAQDGRPRPLPGGPPQPHNAVSRPVR